MDRHSSEPPTRDRRRERGDANGRGTGSAAHPLTLRHVFKRSVGEEEQRTLVKRGRRPGDLHAVPRLECSQPFGLAVARSGMRPSAADGTGFHLVQRREHGVVLRMHLSIHARHALERRARRVGKRLALVDGICLDLEPGKRCIASVQWAGSEPALRFQWPDCP